MDQVKIGLFIRECRKAKNLTQEQLANQLYLTPKTISKWETGNGTPDVSVMHDLCDALGISLNELFVGEYIKEEDKHKVSEEILLKMYAEEQNKNKRLYLATYIIAGVLLSFFILCVLTISYGELPDYLRIILIIVGVALLVVGTVFISILDIQTGYYECPHCHERFSLTLREYLLSEHTFTKRRLKCPKCGKISWCARRTSKQKNKQI